MAELGDSSQRQPERSTGKVTPTGMYAKEIVTQYVQWDKRLGEKKALAVLKEVYFRLAMSNGDAKKIMEVTREELELLDQELQTVLALADDSPDDDLYST